MNSREKRIRILDLQDKYCQTCEYTMQPLKECIQIHQCKIGKEFKSLTKDLFVESKGRKTKEEWDKVCRQAVELEGQGFGAISISKQLSCSRSTLYEQLKKRGLWKGKKQTEIQEQSRAKWENWCQQAKSLRKKGWSYPKIAQYLRIPASNLRDQMRKRGFDGG
ncbi:hypothetical protein [Bacillus cereus]|uniref:hypothetical protein n=1 Tax=Bacillus cereus TaxID=1396 RepID=UPI0018CF14AB|nr:hypothetical protein [Bacillus cereus]MBG9612211.1 hypothetical protein [Bacillus cereus]